MKKNKFSDLIGIGLKKKESLKKRVGSNIRKQSEFILSNMNLNCFKKILFTKKVGQTLNIILKKHLLKIVNMKNYRGFRHKNLYPVRGQRTHTNAKTVKKIKKIIR